MPCRISPMGSADLAKWLTEWYQRPSQAHREPAAVDRSIKRELQKLASDPTLRYMQGLSPDSRETIAVARYNIYPSGRTKADLDRELQEYREALVTETASMTDFIAQAMVHRRSIMSDRPFLLLANLETIEEYQGRGVGGLLVQWGIDFAREKGMQVYLEAGESVTGFYERFGFVKVVQFSIAGAGDEEAGEMIFCMVRSLSSEE